MTDPIADMLTRIRNAIRAGHSSVEFPASKIKYEIAKILKNSGYAEKVVLVQKKNKKDRIEIDLKFDEKVPVIRDLKRVSKPGQRVYVNHDKIQKVVGGYGIVIISTSKGLMTGKEARKNKMGGEILCEIW